MKPRVSVIMPSLNVGSYIREALQSVVAQTLRDIEIICVDAGSTDGTLEVIREFAANDKRVRLVMSDRKSYGRQMNLGLAAARGKYIGIVETDDAVLPDMYESLFRQAEAMRTDVLKADYIRFAGNLKDGTCERTVMPCCQHPGLYGHVVDPFRDPRAIQFTIICGNLYLRSFLKKNGIRFNETPGASYQDMGFYLQTNLLARRMAFCNRPFYLYRRDNPNSSINNPEKVYVICAELEWADRQLLRHPVAKAKFSLLLGREKFFAYWSALHRIGSQFKLEFLRRFSADLKKWMEAGELDSSSFGKLNWQRIVQIALHPEAFFYETFPGPARPLYVDRVTSHREVIVSLTSFPPRIGMVGKTIRSLLSQSRMPDRVLLYLKEEEFPGRVLPDELLELARGNNRFEIRFVGENYRSHAKYYYVFRDYPEAVVILADDDILYPKDHVQKLFEVYSRHPYAICCRRAHSVVPRDDGTLAPYIEWMRSTKIVGEPSMLTFPTTGFGTLYPPHCLDPEVLDVDTAMMLTPSADDLWLFWHALRAGTPTCFDGGYEYQLIDGSQETSLWNGNVKGGGNDKCWRALCKRYSAETLQLGRWLYLDRLRRWPRSGGALRLTGRRRSKCLGLRLCLAENGLGYTAWHVFEKAFGKLGEVCRSMAARSRGRMRASERRLEASHADVKVSVVIPVYNAAAYLPECLDSILGQNLREIEVVCVDDGSTDDSATILRRYAHDDHRVRVITQVNSGASVARNRGLRMARGAFVAFMDPDDLYPNKRVLRLLYTAAKTNNVKIAGGSLERFDPESPSTLEHPRNHAFHKDGCHYFAEKPFDFGYQRFIFERNMLLDNGIVFPDVTRYQDPPFFVRAMTAAGRYCGLRAYTYRYRLGHQQIDWSKRDFIKARDVMRSMADVVRYACQQELWPLVEISRRRVLNDFAPVFFGQMKDAAGRLEFQELLAAFPVHMRDEILKASEISVQ